MTNSGTYNGANADTLAIKQQQLQFYLGAQAAFATGAQSYRIGNRQINYVDASKMQEMINQLMLEIVMLQNGGRRRSWRVVPRDL